MFWNKKIIEVFKTDTSQLEDIKAQMDEIHRTYAKPENAYSDMNIDRFQDSVSLDIVSAYYLKAKKLAQFTKDVRELREVVEGNGGYWGQYQANYKECQDRLELATLKLNIEQELYLKIYQKNRELESKLYVVERELEILKGEVK